MEDLTDSWRDFIADWGAGDFIADVVRSGDWKRVRELCDQGGGAATVVVYTLHAMLRASEDVEEAGDLSLRLLDAVKQPFEMETTSMAFLLPCTDEAWATHCYYVATYGTPQQLLDLYALCDSRGKFNVVADAIVNRQRLPEALEVARQQLLRKADKSAARMVDSLWRRQVLRGRDDLEELVDVLLKRLRSRDVEVAARCALSVVDILRWSDEETRASNIDKLRQGTERLRQVLPRTDDDLFFDATLAMGSVWNEFDAIKAKPEVFLKMLHDTIHTPLSSRQVNALLGAISSLYKFAQPGWARTCRLFLSTESVRRKAVSTLRCLAEEGVDIRAADWDLLKSFEQDPRHREHEAAALSLSRIAQNRSLDETRHHFVQLAITEVTSDTFLREVYEQALLRACQDDETAAAADDQLQRMAPGSPLHQKVQALRTKSTMG